MPAFLFRPIASVCRNDMSSGAEKGESSSPFHTSAAPHFHYAENDSRILSPLVSFAERCECFCRVHVE